VVRPGLILWGILLKELNNFPAVAILRPSKVLVLGASGRIVAQLVEQLTLNQRVVGSIPTDPTIFPLGAVP
jgi:hypothetical protein